LLKGRAVAQFEIFRGFSRDKDSLDPDEEETADKKKPA